MDSITSGLPSSTLDVPKRKIHQIVPSGAIKRGPHAIVRTVDLNTGIEIQRRSGEGSVPLFDRHDITVNQTISEGRDANISHDQNTGSKYKTNRRSSSTESSSPERYRHRDIKKHSSSTSGRRKSPERSSRNERPNYNCDKHSYNSKYSNHKNSDKYTRKETSKSHSPSPMKKKPVEKIPYYRDEQREKDRLRRLYGRSHSRTPPKSSTARKYSPIAKRRIKSPPKRRRSTSRERYRKYSPHRSSRRDYRTRRSRSRTHSPSRRERHKHSSRCSREREEHKEEANTLAATVIPPTPQIITIPVAVPADYAAYSFPGWTAPQPPWHPSHHRPPASNFAPFPMLSMIPPLRPPYQASYAGLPTTLPYAPYRPHIPQRYPPPRHNTNTHQPRPKKPSS